jgi:hypothetical protein
METNYICTEQTESQRILRLNTSARMVFFGQKGPFFKVSAAGFNLHRFNKNLLWCLLGQIPIAFKLKSTQRMRETQYEK